MTTPITMSRAAPGGTLDAPGLEVFLRADRGGPVLDREPVRRADLALAIQGAWLELCLRRGRPDLTVEDLDLRVVPIPSESESTRFSGFALVAAEPGADGNPQSVELSLYSLERVARRAEARCREQGTLPADGMFYFSLDAAPVRSEADRPAISGAGPADFEVTVAQPPLHLLSVPVPSLIRESRVEGALREEAFPVFYTERAHAEAERFARQGAPGRPDFESGAILAGSLGSCPETGEFFAVITDAFEMTDADASLVKLEPTALTWTRIMAVVRARQRVEPAHTLLGNAHGHLFLPNNGETCAECPHLAECSTTNVHPSEADFDWTRSHFPHAPYVLCHIHGFSARGDRVHGLFGLHDARLLARHYFILPDFNPADHPVITVKR